MLVCKRCKMAFHLVLAETGVLGLGLEQGLACRTAEKTLDFVPAAMEMLWFAAVWSKRRLHYAHGGICTFFLHVSRCCRHPHQHSYALQRAGDAVVGCSILQHT